VMRNLGHDSLANRDLAYDFKGNLLRSSRQFLDDYKALPDWSTAPKLQLAVFANGAQYDALNRSISITTPDGSVIQTTYNEANLLERVDVKLWGAAAATPFVSSIDYNARGERVFAEYGNGAATSYTYDPATFRVVRIKTNRSGFPAGQGVVQDLFYTYDPAGNITHIKDDADTQNVIFFRNKRVEPSADYTYDAIYRLVKASGREHLGQNGAGQALPPSPTSYNDVSHVGRLHPGDGNAM